MMVKSIIIKGKDCVWQVQLTVPENIAHLFVDGLSDAADSLSYFEDEENESWQIFMYCENQPDINDIDTRMEILALVCGIECPEYVIEEVANRDWVTESQKKFTPVNAGKFYIYPEWDKENIPLDKIAIQITPQRAFGTGSHATTSGCLQLLSNMAEDFTPKSILDLGCGSGILAIAAAKIWPDAVIDAADNDKWAVETTEFNIKNNGVPHVNSILSEGYADIGNKKYDLIIANILADALIGLAEDNFDHLNKGGRIILSGILERQKGDVLDKYTSLSFSFAEEIQNEYWPSLVLMKP